MIFSNYSQRSIVLIESSPFEKFMISLNSPEVWLDKWCPPSPQSFGGWGELRKRALGKMRLVVIDLNGCVPHPSAAHLD